MKEEFFNELVESIKEAKAIRKGERMPSRVTVIEEPNVVEIRKKTQIESGRICGLTRN